MQSKTNQVSTSPMKNLFIIDANSLIHRAFHALPAFTNAEGTPTGALYGVANMVTKIIKEKNPDYIAAAFDRPEPTFRDQEYAEYKGTRAATVNELISQIIESRHLFQMMNVKTFEMPGWEADDILMTLTRKFMKEPNLKITTFSGDLDLLQAVVGDKVVAEVPKQGIKEAMPYNEAAVIERFGVKPSQLADYKGLVGDKSDNIPGVAGIGPKTAALIINKYGPLETLFQDIEDIGLADKKIEAKLKGAKEKALMSKRLATLRADVPLNVSLEDLKLRPLNLATTLPYFRKMGFMSLAARLEKDYNSNHAAS